MSQSATKKVAIIIGAGPAGLTAAYQLLHQTDIKPILFESSQYVGGIAKTIRYRGNRIDLGGHRFFSKSDRVMDWWLKIMPLERVDPNSEQKLRINYQQQQRELALPGEGADPKLDDLVMLVRERRSRIYFERKFFDYPLSLTPDTMIKLGLPRMIRLGISYVKSRLLPIKDERTLEDFFINRFGRELYETFFKSYTEKVWGIPCTELSAEWGAQRVKDLSIAKALAHAVKKLFRTDRSIDQKQVQTSLIERFLYPKHGPGQMWEEVAARVIDLGGELHLGKAATGFRLNADNVTEVAVRDDAGETVWHAADFVFSTMPVKELIEAIGDPVPQKVRDSAAELTYRDFLTVGMLVKKLKVGSRGPSHAQTLITDNWIYIQEPDVLVGRIQIFNNWSPYLVEDANTVWLGLEYFCFEGDALWSRQDAELTEFAIGELIQLGFIDREDFLDSTVARMPKAYPTYNSGYEHFPLIREYADQLQNLFLIGRNGMHRYNNQDHSMLTAMVAVDNIAAGQTSKENIWAVNTESDYHEEVGSKE